MQSPGLVARAGALGTNAACHDWLDRGSSLAQAPRPQDGDHMVAESSEYEGTPLLRRGRSAILLAALVVVLGAIAAGILGVLIVAGTSLIDHALG